MGYVPGRFVIYRDAYGWEGAIEFTTGRWFKKTKHAPVTHAKTAEEVFAWLYARYPDRVIAHDPAVSERYNPTPKPF
jgi:hypothetical protein